MHALRASQDSSLILAIRCLEHACVDHCPSSQRTPLMIQEGGKPSMKGGDISVGDYYSLVAMRVPNRIKEEIHSQGSSRPEQINKSCCGSCNLRKQAKGMPEKALESSRALVKCIQGNQGDGRRIGRVQSEREGLEWEISRMEYASYWPKPLEWSISIGNKEYEFSSSAFLSI
eukprot:Gb_33110 [translate_table: standard]